MHLLLSANGDDDALLAELAHCLPGGRGEVLSPGLVRFTGPAEVVEDSWPAVARVRQCLPDAELVTAPSIRAWAETAFVALVSRLPDGQPWRLLIAPHYGIRPVARIGQRAWHTATRRGGAPPSQNRAPAAAPALTPDASAGQNRCELIREALRELLKERRRRLLRQLHEEPDPFRPGDSVLQLLLTSPDRGWLSLAPAPRPFQARRWLSPYPKGEIPVASDKAAPSRAFAKLVEAELRLGRRIAAGETCVDLGAAPGSWSYVALQRGASVTAVDRAPLRDDLMANPRLTFHRGDAFGFTPAAPVDWLVCDVIAAPERSAELTLNWLRRGWARHFIVTLKLKGDGDQAALDLLRRELPALAGEWFLTHLCANRHEACVFGSAHPTERSAAGLVRV